MLFIYTICLSTYKLIDKCNPKPNFMLFEKINVIKLSFSKKKKSIKNMLYVSQNTKILKEN